MMLTLALPAAAAPQASAATLEGGRKLVFTAAQGERNDLTIRVSGDRSSIVFVDSGAAIETGPGCSGGGMPGEPATCPLDGPGIGRTIRADLGNRADVFDSTGLTRQDIGGGYGNVKVFGGDEPDLIETGSSEDGISAGKGDDVVRAGPGSDRILIQGNDGDDRYDGGGGSTPGESRGSDFLSYGRFDDPVRVTLDGAGADGRPGERDDLRGIETVYGSTKDDVLIGSRFSNGLNGLGGNDVVRGGGGNDRISDEEGNDLLIGGPAATT